MAVKSIERRALEWIASGDTGLSSKTIWSVMMDIDTDDRAAVPWDSDDFGRCLRLIQKIPEWRERLPEVSAKYPEWRDTIDFWDAIEERCSADEFFDVEQYGRELRNHTKATVE